MTLRCGCPNDADDIVFGPDHKCSLKPEPTPKREPPASRAARAARVLGADGWDPDVLHPYEDRLDAAERGQC